MATVPATAPTGSFHVHFKLKLSLAGIACLGVAVTGRWVAVARRSWRRSPGCRPPDARPRAPGQVGSRRRLHRLAARWARRAGGQGHCVAGQAPSSARACGRVAALTTTATAAVAATATTRAAGGPLACVAQAEPAVCVWLWLFVCVCVCVCVHVVYARAAGRGGGACGWVWACELWLCGQGPINPETPKPQTPKP